MTRRAFWRATALGSVLQAAVVLLGVLVPSLRQDNLYPIGGTLVALLTGWCSVRWSSELTLPASLWRGGFAGGFSSLLGSTLAALTGQLPSPFSMALVAGVTGGLAGGVGAGFGKLLARERPPG